MADRPRSIALAVILVTGVLLAPPLDEAGRETSQTPVQNVIAPHFEIHVRRDRVLVTGHSPSLEHEARLRELTERAFPGLEPRFDFRPLGLVPDWWEQTTGQLVTALAPTISPSAILSPDSLHIRALVGTDTGETASLRALADSLQLGIRMQLEVAPSGHGATVQASCARHFENFEHGAVNFEESGTVMRSSAIHVLDRVVALADACRDSRVSITGHTDSSGNEALNRELSLARARAVAAHLTSRGIASERLLVHGAGSAEPIADNATRYGRSLNRRIVIEFVPAQ